MKKPIIFLLLLLVVAQLRAQVVFKFAYQPKTAYTINKDVKMNMTADNPAASAPGAAPTMNMVMSTNTTSVITTGEVQSDLIPIKFTMKANQVSVNVNGQAMPTGDMPAEPMRLYGKYTIAGKLTVDSVAGEKLDDNLKALMVKTIEAVQNGVTFPDRALSPGDTFTQEVPLALPFPGLSGGNEVHIKVTYKLLNIVNNIAVFDYTQVAESSPDAQGHSVPMAITGKGDGSFEFDITNHFFTSMTSNLTMTFVNTMGGVNMKGTVTTQSVDKVVIAKN